MCRRALAGAVLVTLVAATLIATGSDVAAPALAVDASPPVISPAGVGSVGLGKRYDALRDAHFVGPLGAGCELAGPQARSARLLSPLKGSVELTDSSPRTVRAITILAGASARGIGVGASAARVRHAFPRATFDRGTDAMFGVTLVTVPRGGGGKLQLALSAKTGRVTAIGVPFIPICE